LSIDLSTRANDAYTGGFLTGLIAPHTDMTIEHDLHRLCPQARICTGRMYLEPTDITLDSIRKMLRVEFPRIARQLGDMPLHAAIFGSTAASAVGGMRADAQVRQSLQELTGADAITVFSAVVEALQNGDSRSVLLVTPYPTAVTKALESALAHEGIPIVRSASMELDTDVAIGSVPLREITSFTLENFRSDIDSVFISCTNLRAAEVASTIASELGVPVLSSNLAVAQKLNALAGLTVSDPIV
jgi:maleate isomerase